MLRSPACALLALLMPAASALAFQDNSDETTLRSDPNNRDAHTNLMQKYCKLMAEDNDPLRCAKQMVWFIHNHPDDENLSRSSSGLVKSTEAIKQVKEAWDERLRSGTNDAAVRRNAMTFSMMSDPKMVNQLATMARDAPPRPKPKAPVAPATPSIDATEAEAHLIHRVEPENPRVRPNGYTGPGELLVEINAIIRPDGTVQEVRLKQGHPSGAIPVIHAVMQWKYRPFLRDGTPSTVTIPMTFEIPFP